MTHVQKDGFNHKGTKARRKAKGGCHAQAEGAGMCPHTQSMAALRLTMAPRAAGLARAAEFDKRVGCGAENRD